MEAHHRQVVRGGRGDGRHAGDEALRHVHADQREVVPFEELECLLTVAIVEPRRVAELDGQAEVLESFGGLDDVLLVLAPDHEPLGELEQDGPQLAGGVQWHQGVVEPLPHLFGELLGKLLAVHAGLVADLLRQRLLHLGVQRVPFRRVVREQGIRLHVEGEVPRRPIDPEHRVPFRRREVVGRIDLDDREPRCVELQARLRGLGLGRIEVALLHEGRVRPARRADQDAAGHLRGTAPTPSPRPRGGRVRSSLVRPRRAGAAERRSALPSRAGVCRRTLRPASPETRDERWWDV